MKSFTKYGAVALLLFSLASCEQDANVDLPETDPKLVLNAFITPQDTLIHVRVTRSRPIFETYNVNTSNAISNATVVLNGNNTSVQLVYNSTSEEYEISTSVFPIIAGNEYHLVVSDTHGFTADAYTTVPLSGPLNFTVNETDSLLESDPGYFYYRGRFQYSFDDPASTTDFYRLFVAGIYLDTLTGDTMSNKFISDLFTDENVNGTTVNDYSDVEYSVTGYFNDTLVAFDVWMIHASREYYNFHRSLYNYNGGGDPFSEPTLIFTNVTNGLGIFAGANQEKRRIYR